MYRQLSILLIIINISTGQSRIELPHRSPENVSRGLSYYENILKDSPDLHEAHFGAGHSAYSIENFDRAEKEFEVATQSKVKKLQSMSYYNLGNTLHQKGQFKQSLMAYRKAIQLDPSDMDAKYNYELTQQMLQQKQTQQSKPKQSDEIKDDKGEDQKEEQQKKQQHNQDFSDQSNPEQSPENHQQEQQPLSEIPNAKATLDALKADEENLMKRKLGHFLTKNLDKDW